ncbi:MAG: HAD family phosphatase [Deltaproteobacteria bacterium]|nr:HAD family phosphatase [Deltaproteobacteria bacterium]
MQIKAVFFDLGNVLLGFDWKRTYSGILEKSLLSPEELGKRFYRTRYIQYELNQISTDEFFSELKELLQYEGTTEKLRDIVQDIFFPLEKNIALAKSLSCDYRLGIISNTNQVHADFFEAQYDFLDLFKVRIYSHQAGVRKPDREIYDLALSLMRVAPEESIFIDDMKENVEAARELGWNTIHYKNDTDLERELSSMGVMTSP